MPGRQLVIVLCGFGRRLGAADRVDFGVGELFHGKCLMVTALEALILVHREDHEPIPSVPGDCQWRLERLVLLTTEFSLEFRRRYPLPCSRFELHTPANPNCQASGLESTLCRCAPTLDKRVRRQNTWNQDVLNTACGIFQSPSSLFWGRRWRWRRFDGS